MMGRRCSRVLRVIGVGTAVLVGATFSTIANASPSAARQAVAKPAAAALNLTPAATNCGDGVSYLPAKGQAMTAADFAALRIPVPSAGSPLAGPGTRWIVPHCDPLPAGQDPGGPAIRLTSTGSAQAGPRNVGSAHMLPSPNWTGFQSDGGGPYQAASTEWSIPSSFPTPPGATWESSWAGIGSGANDSDALFQAGTGTDVSTGDVVTNYAWWEFFPGNKEKVVNLSIQSGSFDFAEVVHTGYGKGEAEVCTRPAGASSWTCTSIGVSWGTAYTIGTSQFECIAERTELGNGWLPRVTDISGAQFYDCEADNGNWRAIGNINRYYYWMAKTQTASQCRTAPWAIETGSIYNSDDFGFRWYGYGWPIPRADC